MKMIDKKILVLAGSIIMATQVQAAVFSAQGTVSNVDSTQGIALPTLTSVGDSVSISASFDEIAFQSGTITADDVLGITAIFGTTCISDDPNNTCPQGTVLLEVVPNLNNTSSYAQSSTYSLNAGGTIDFSFILFNYSVPLSLILTDINSGTGSFSIDGNTSQPITFGYVEGSLSYSINSEVPVPASIWFMGSALAGISVIRRRKKA